MNTDPDEVISNSGSTTGRWLRAMADIEHEEHDDEEPDHETGPERDRN